MKKYLYITICLVRMTTSGVLHRWVCITSEEATQLFSKVVVVIHFAPSIILAIVDPLNPV